MADYTYIKQEIQTNLPDNEEQLITAEIVRTTLTDMIDAVDSVEDGIVSYFNGKIDEIDVNFKTGQAVSNVEIVDNLSSDNNDYVLSAYQGKVLYRYCNTLSDMIGNLGNEKADKDPDASETQITMFDNKGNITHSDLFISDVATQKDLNIKLDVLDPTDFRKLTMIDEHGQLTPTSFKATQVATWTDVNTYLNAKVDKPNTYTAGHFAMMTANGNIADSTYAYSDFVMANNLPQYSMAAVTTTSGFAATYSLTKDSVNTGALINIPRNIIEKTTSVPLGGLEPNTFYDFGTLTGTQSIEYSSTPISVNEVNIYMFSFDTGSSLPTITWPTGIQWVDGAAPIIEANTHYEINIMDNIAVFIDTPISI